MGMVDTQDTLKWAFSFADGAATANNLNGM
jgi:hypothetical protein